MLNVPSAIINAINILLCFGMVVYSVKWYKIFRGGRTQNGLVLMITSVSFFLLAAIASGTRIWGIVPAELDYLELTVRMVAFLALFASLVMIVRTWSTLGNK